MLPIPQAVPLRNALVPVLFVILLAVTAYSQVSQAAVPDNKNRSPIAEKASQPPKN